MAMGGSSEHWTNQHVQRHHIETNIIPVDYDTMYPVKRVLAACACARAGACVVRVGVSVGWCARARPRGHA